MDDWDLLFLQAAGKGVKRSSVESSQPDRGSSIQKAAAPRPSISTSVDTSNHSKKAKGSSLALRGVASECLKQAGFRFSDTADFKRKGSYAACYQLIDVWSDQGKSCDSVQHTIRTMFVIVRNSRAAGFAPFKKSTAPIRHAYRKKKNSLYKSLLEMRSLAALCPEVVSTREHIQVAIDSLASVSKDEGESDKEDSADVIETSRQHLNIQKRRRDQTRNCRALCLQLISSLDMIYGELLVVALDRGVHLPDPRLYLESLSGQVSNCERSVKKCPGTASSIDRESSDYNPLLRYLELRALEAVALNIPALMKAAVDQEGLCTGPDEGTMRGTEPLSCSTVRSWWHACRFRVAAWSAFACPNISAITALKAFSTDHGIFEVGAGSGYWALMMRNSGIDVLAYDKQPPSTLSSKSSNQMQVQQSKKIMSNEYHGRFSAWSEVLSGDASSPFNTNRVLFLCYPPPNSPMAVRALQGYKGSRVAYVGEMQGDTGTLDFESRLRTQWELVSEPISLPNFSDTCYSLTLWERRKKITNVPVLTSPVPSWPWPFKCVSCGISPHTTDKKSSFAHFYRDRLTRAVWACSIECTRTDVSRSVLTQQLSVRYITYGLSETDDDNDGIWKKIAL